MIPSSLLCAESFMVSLIVPIPVVTASESFKIVHWPQFERALSPNTSQKNLCILNLSEWNRNIRAFVFNTNNSSTLSKVVATANQYSLVLCFGLFNWVAIKCSLSPDVKELNNFPQYFPWV